VSPVKYELDSYILEDDILHSHCHENLKSYNLMTCQVFSEKASDSSAFVHAMCISKRVLSVKEHCSYFDLDCPTSR
jgi:hypothetical protein